MQVLNGDSNMAEKKEVIEEMVANLDATLASILEVVINEELVISYGLPEEMASTLVRSLSKMFKKLAKEEITAEDRAAVNMLLNLAYYTPGSYSHAFDHSGEAGALGISAERLVNVIEKSPTVADACVDMLNGFSDTLVGKLSDQDKQTLVEVAANCEYQKLQKALERIAD